MFFIAAKSTTARSQISKEYAHMYIRIACIMSSIRGIRDDIIHFQSISHRWATLANSQYGTRFIYTLHSRMYLIQSSHCYLAAAWQHMWLMAVLRPIAQPTVPINRHRTRPDHDHVTRHRRSVCFDNSLSAVAAVLMIIVYILFIYVPHLVTVFFFSFLSISLSTSFRFVRTPIACIVSLYAACELIRPHEVDRNTLPNAYSYSRLIHSQTYHTEAFRFVVKITERRFNYCCCFFFRLHPKRNDRCISIALYARVCALC